LTRGRALVLLYHQVAERRVDPWGLAVTPANFRSQLDVLARRWRPIDLDTLASARRRRSVPDRAVAVTFDDGYADNLELAAPLLAEHAAPATLFVASALVQSARAPWWDELAALVLEPEHVPATLALRVRGCDRRWRLAPLADEDRPPHVNEVRPWRARPGTRLEAYYRIWSELRLLPPGEREPLLEEIGRWAGEQGRISPRPRVLTVEQLREFSGRTGLALGGHTVSHPALPACTRAEREREIADGAAWLRERIGTGPRHFAYPFGDWTRAVARTVEQLGFSAAYTAAAGHVGWRSPLYALPRIPVGNYGGDELDRRLELVLARRR
jgi:peptidoglycan/xylan/chitin deacetylase (PgdA/CDA1 family)